MRPVPLRVMRPVPLRVMGPAPLRILQSDFHADRRLYPGTH